MQYRKSKQRDLILEVIRNSNMHPTADWIYNEARKTEPKLSLGTVYRNLDILCKLGTIMKVMSGASIECYDMNPTPHYHFLCTECEQIFDIDIEYNQNLDEQMRSMGQDVIQHRLVFDGRCEECLQKSSI